MEKWQIELLTECERYPVITFDVFDTLVLRMVSRPTEVFSKLHGRMFSIARQGAERIARRFNRKEEIELSDIYRFLPGYNMDEEIQIEKNVCFANPYMAEVYQILKKNDKKIYAISDMYLSKKDIEDILQKSNYVLEDVYVSSEYGVCKKTGNLFKVFCENTGIKPEKILHIGDNLDSDVEGAKMMEINGFLVPSVKKIL